MKVAVFGTGYVGLVTGTCLSQAGHIVSCVDVDADKIDNLKQGVLPIFEPGLDVLVRENIASNRLKFTLHAAEAVKNSDIIFIAVGTPPDEDGSADLSYVLSVAETIAEEMTESKIVINKSTVPVGTGDLVKQHMQKILVSLGKSINFDVASNPEFLKEGAAVNDFMKPDRIVIGTDSQYVEKCLRELYAPFNRNHDRMIFMDIRSAELTKYAANALLATKISFMNEMANLADLLGADIENVRNGIGSDPRIGYSFIYPGCGYGGSCFPKDVNAIIKMAERVGYNASIVAAVEKVNREQKQVMFSLLHRAFDGQLKSKTIAVWGLAFKPNTDDMREASSRSLIEAIWAAGASVRVYDPEAMDEARRIYGNRSDLIFCDSKEQALKGSDALTICTEWKEFMAPDFDVISDSLVSPVVVDGRNLYSPAAMSAKGLQYYCIGRNYSQLSV